MDAGIAVALASVGTAIVTAAGGVLVALLTNRKEAENAAEQAAEAASEKANLDRVAALQERLALKDEQIAALEWKVRNRDEQIAQLGREREGYE